MLFKTKAVIQRPGSISQSKGTSSLGIRRDEKWQQKTVRRREKGSSTFNQQSSNDASKALTTFDASRNLSRSALLLGPIICAMSAASALAKNYPEAEGYWREISQLYTRTPTTTSHLTFTVKPVAEVEVGALVLLPMPDAVPEQVPSAEDIYYTYLLWCKVVGKQESSGGTDLLVDVVGGREHYQLPETPGLTFRQVANLLVPTQLLLQTTDYTRPTATKPVREKKVSGAASTAPAAQSSNKVASRGCSRVFVLHVLCSLADIMRGKRFRCLNSVASEQEVWRLLEAAANACDLPSYEEMEKRYGGRPFNAQDTSTYWTEKRQVGAWWGKHTCLVKGFDTYSLINHAQYDGGVTSEVQRARWSLAVVTQVAAICACLDTKDAFIEAIPASLTAAITATAATAPVAPTTRTVSAPAPASVPASPSVSPSPSVSASAPTLAPAPAPTPASVPTPAPTPAPAPASARGGGYRAMSASLGTHTGEAAAHSSGSSSSAPPLDTVGHYGPQTEAPVNISYGCSRVFILKVLSSLADFVQRTGVTSINTITRNLLQNCLSEAKRACCLPRYREDEALYGGASFVDRDPRTHWTKVQQLVNWWERNVLSEQGFDALQKLQYYGAEHRKTPTARWSGVVVKLCTAIRNSMAASSSVDATSASATAATATTTSTTSAPPTAPRPSGPAFFNASARNGDRAMSAYLSAHTGEAAAPSYGSCRSSGGMGADGDRDRDGGRGRSRDRERNSDRERSRDRDRGRDRDLSRESRDRGPNGERGRDQRNWGPNSDWNMDPSRDSRDRGPNRDRGMEQRDWGGGGGGGAVHGYPRWCHG